MKQFLLGVIVALSVTLIAFFAYTLGKSQQSPKTPPQAQSDILPTPTPLPEPTPVGTIDPTIAADIQAALTSKNYSALSQLMTPKLVVTKYATECCGLLTSTQAVAELSYLNGAVQNWEIVNATPLGESLMSIQPQTFENALILTSGEFMAAFHFNQNSLIDKIFLTSALSFYLSIHPTPTP